MVKYVDGDNGGSSVDGVTLLVGPVTYSDCLHRSGWPDLDKNFSSAAGPSYLGYCEFFVPAGVECVPADASLPVRREYNK